MTPPRTAGTEPGDAAQSAGVVSIKTAVTAQHLRLRCLTGDAAAVREVIALGLSLGREGQRAVRGLTPLTAPRHAIDAAEEIVEWVEYWLLVDV